MLVARRAVLSAAVVVVAVTAITLVLDYDDLVRRRRRREAGVDFGIDHCQTVAASRDAGWAFEQGARDDPFHRSTRQIAAEVYFGNLIQKDLRRIQASA